MKRHTLGIFLIVLLYFFPFIQQRVFAVDFYVPDVQITPISIPLQGSIVLPTVSLPAIPPIDVQKDILPLPTGFPSATAISKIPTSLPDAIVSGLGSIGDAASNFFGSFIQQVFSNVLQSLWDMVGPIAENIVFVILGIGLLFLSGFLMYILLRWREKT